MSRRARRRPLILAVLGPLLLVGAVLDLVLVLLLFLDQLGGGVDGVLHFAAIELEGGLQVLAVMPVLALLTLGLVAVGYRLTFPGRGTRVLAVSYWLCAAGLIAAVQLLGNAPAEWLPVTLVTGAGLSALFTWYLYFWPDVDAYFREVEEGS